VERIQPGRLASEDLPGRRRAIRYAVPVVAVSAAAATIGLLPALAGAASPNLSKITTKQLIEKVAASNTQTLSGTVRVSTDVGLPSFLAGATGGDPFDDAMRSAGPDRDSSDNAADPRQHLIQLLSGTHILQVAADGPEKQKLSIVQDTAEYSQIHNGQNVWAYNSGSNSAYHDVLPTDNHADRYEGASVTPQEAAEKVLAAVDDTTSVTVDGTASVAGRDAYQLLIKPKQSGTTIGSIRIAVDSTTGVPLRFTLTPSSGGQAAVDVGFTKVSFAKPTASTFSFTAPRGVKVTTEKLDQNRAKGDTAKSGGTAAHKLPGAKGTDKPYELGDINGLDGLSRLDDLHRSGVIGKGWTSVVEFKAPAGAPELAAAGGSDSPLGSLGKKVSGDFGSGTFINTRLVNALITDTGTVYVGAVDQDTLIKVADSVAAK
jgi:outer membrane lipoprotein-sorting protein